MIDPLFNWFRANLLLMESDNRMGRIAVTADGLQHPTARDGVLTLLQAADLGITDIERVKMDPEFAEYPTRWARLNRHNVVLDISDSGMTSDALVRRAQEHARAGRLRRGDPGFDESWCVFDVDKHPHLQQAVNNAEAERKRIPPAPARCSRTEEIAGALAVRGETPRCTESGDAPAEQDA